MGLLVIHHLQPVLQPSQKAIGLGHLLGGPPVDPLDPGQRIQGGDGSAIAQFRDAAAPDQLLRLAEKLDLADAAAAQLYVVAVDRDSRAAAMGVDLALDRMHVLNRREIQILAPDIGAQMMQESLACFYIAGHRARLYHGGALPVLADAFVIGLRGLGGYGDGGSAGVGAQSQIGTEHIAVGGARIDEMHQLPGSLDEDRSHRLGRRAAHPVGVIQHDQVDIAGIVQLPRPQLAHAEDDVA